MCVVKLLKWIALTINSILLIAGIIIAIFGVILWKTDIRSFDDSVQYFLQFYYYHNFRISVVRLRENNSTVHSENQS